ncbi:MAG TPA: ABC transporter ATP-binding protein [Stenomitos sp.]
MAILEVSIQKRLGDLLLAVDLAVGPGVTAVVGPSGSGKTTLLRCLAGLERPDQGRIDRAGEAWFDAQAGVNRPVQARRVGFVFSDYALFPHLTVRRNVAFGARSGAQVDAGLARLGLEALGDRYPRELSAGEQQRVAIARALATEPHLLLMDEPFSSLDPHLKERLYGEFGTLQQDLGLPVVLVTHDLREACLLAAQVVVLHAGRVIQAGVPRDILYRPATPEVAYLAGIPNVHAGAIAPSGHLEWGPVRLAVAPPVPLSGSMVSWCIRAEQIELADGPGPNVVEAVVTSRGLLGSGYRLTCQVAGAGALQAILPVAQAERSGAQIGAALWLRLPPEALHLMGEWSGRLAERGL